MSHFAAELRSQGLIEKKPFLTSHSILNVTSNIEVS